MRLQRSTTTRSFRRLRNSVGVLAAGVTAIIGTSMAGTASALPEPAQTAAHTHPHIMPMKTGNATPAISSGVLDYHNGPTQHASSVYLVYYGSQWNSDPNGVKPYLQNLFNGLGTSSDSWSRVTSQYTDTSGLGPSFSGPELRGTWADNTFAAPTNPTASQLSSEANRAASHFGVSGTNVQIVVLSPSGTHPDGFPSAGFCAWHDWNGTVTYTNMPYVLDAGSSCGANSVRGPLDGFSIVEGHEYSETLSDPRLNAYWDTQTGEENADLCAWKGLAAISLPTGTFAMQPTWSNSANSCRMS
jgi:serine protease